MTLCQSSFSSASLFSFVSRDDNKTRETSTGYGPRSSLKVFFTQVFLCDIDSGVELSMEDRLLIEKLSGPENWATWTFQMEHLMKAKGLWGMVAETENVPDGANAQTRAEFEKRKEKVLCVGAECEYTSIVSDNKL